MSKEALDRVIRRLAEDEAFMDRYLADPDEALGEYDLSDEERAAVLSEDPGRVEGLGAERGVVETIITILGDKCPARSQT